MQQQLAKNHYYPPISKLFPSFRKKLYVTTYGDDGKQLKEGSDKKMGEKPNIKKYACGRPLNPLRYLDSSNNT